MLWISSYSVVNVIGLIVLSRGNNYMFLKYKF